MSKPADTNDASSGLCSTRAHSAQCLLLAFRAANLEFGRMPVTLLPNPKLPDGLDAMAGGHEPVLTGHLVRWADAEPKVSGWRPGDEEAWKAACTRLRERVLAIAKRATAWAPARSESPRELTRMLDWVRRSVSIPLPEGLLGLLDKVDILAEEMAEADDTAIATSASSVPAWREWLRTFDPSGFGCVAGDGPAPRKKPDGTFDVEAFEAETLEWQRQGCPKEPHWSRNREEAIKRHQASEDSILEGARLSRAVAAEAITKPPYHLAPELRLLAEKLEASIRALGYPHGQSALSEAIHQIEKAKREVDVVEDILHYQASTVSSASAPSAPAEAMSSGLAALLPGTRAAAMIGIGAETLSRWRAHMPAWASGEPKLFQDLMERNDDGLYLRDKVVKLAGWFKASRASGGQKPIACP